MRPNEFETKYLQGEEVCACCKKELAARETYFMGSDGDFCSPECSAEGYIPSITLTLNGKGEVLKIEGL